MFHPRLVGALLLEETRRGHGGLRVSLFAQLQDQSCPPPKDNLQPEGRGLLPWPVLGVSAEQMRDPGLDSRDRPVAQSL